MKNELVYGNAKMTVIAKCAYILSEFMDLGYKSRDCLAARHRMLQYVVED
jgi:hypothetical protein